MSESDFIHWSYFVFSNLTVLPNYVLKEESIIKSEKLIHKIDLKDLTYVALATQLDLIFLTRDKPIFEGLQKQKFRKVLLFEDFLKAI